jgi:hypothetical protein
MSENTPRTELFAALQALSDAIPQMRLGQLVAAVGELCADLHGRGLWDADDAELLEAVWQFHRNFKGGEDTPDSQEAEHADGPERRIRSRVMVE